MSESKGAGAMTEIRERAEQLYQTGDFPNRTAAFRQAYREAQDAATARHRAFLDSLPNDDPTTDDLTAWYNRRFHQMMAADDLI